MRRPWTRWNRPGSGSGCGWSRRRPGRPGRRWWSGPGQDLGLGAGGPGEGPADRDGGGGLDGERGGAVGGALRNVEVEAGTLPGGGDGGALLVGHRDAARRRVHRGRHGDLVRVRTHGHRAQPLPRPAGDRRGLQGQGGPGFGNVAGTLLEPVGELLGVLVRRGDIGAVRVAPDGDLGPRRGGPLRERPGARRLGQCGEVVDLGVGVLEDPPDLPGVPVGAERGLGPRGLQVLRLVLGGVVEVDAVRLELAAAVHGHLEEPGGQLLRTGGGTVLARHAEHGVVEGLQPVEHRRRAALVPSRVVGGRRARPGQGGRRRDETGEQ